jgi:hypothetical protein
LVVVSNANVQIPHAGCAAMNVNLPSPKATDWKPFQKGCMVGSFTLHLPSGLVIRDIAVFQKGQSRFIGMPRQLFTNKEGLKDFKRIIEFRDRKTEDAFRDMALKALDQTFEKKKLA